MSCHVMSKEHRCKDIIPACHSQGNVMCKISWNKQCKARSKSWQFKETKQRQSSLLTCVASILIFMFRSLREPLHGNGKGDVLIVINQCCLLISWSETSWSLTVHLLTSWSMTSWSVDSILYILLWSSLFQSLTELFVPGGSYLLTSCLFSFLNIYGTWWLQEPPGQNSMRDLVAHASLCNIGLKTLRSFILARRSKTSWLYIKNLEFIMYTCWFIMMYDQLLWMMIYHATTLQQGHSAGLPCFSNECVQEHFLYPRTQTWSTTKCVPSSDWNLFP